MHAIGHYVSQKRARKKYIYVSAETFTTELIEAIRNKTQQAFKDKYRKVDYLLFDDVQFIAGNKYAEDELFYLGKGVYKTQTSGIMEMAEFMGRTGFIENAPEAFTDLVFDNVEGD